MTTAYDRYMTTLRELQAARRSAGELPSTVEDEYALLLDEAWLDMSDDDHARLEGQLVREAAATAGGDHV